MREQFLRRTMLLLLGAAAAGALGVTAAEQPAGGLPLKLVANAFNLGSVGTARRSATVYIYVERWSTEDERLALRKAFQEKGPQGLVDALHDTKPVGTIRTPERLAYDLRYAVQVPTEDGGRRLLIATDRPIGAVEAARNGRTTDYPFSLLELHLDKENKGEGKLALAMQIVVSKDGSQLELENYSSQPVQLKNVKPQR